MKTPRAITLRASLRRLRYSYHLYNGFRKGNRAWSPTRDMAAAPFPRWIQLQTINACQAACRMCPYPLYKNVFPRGRMDDDLFEKVSAEIAAHPEVDTFIPMLQNEPFLDKHILEKVRRFKERTNHRVRVELVTNGAFLTEDTVARIRDSGLDVLDISLDAVSREVYERVRIGLDYDAVTAGVERAIAADLGGTSVFVRLVKIRDNAHEAEAFAERWRARGVSVFVYEAHNRAGALESQDRDWRLTATDLTPLQRAGRRVARAWMGHCPIPFSSANILHNGDLLMCVHDWGRKEVLGNIRDSTIAELWNGPRMQEIRRLVHARRYAELPACAGCSLWKDGWF